MKFTVQIDDDKYEILDKVAQKQGKTLPGLIKENIGLLLKVNPREKQILLEGPDLAAIAAVNGGKNLSSAEDIVKLFKTLLAIKVGDCNFTLDPEDSHSLRAQYTGTYESIMTYEEFVAQSIREALSMYLWGSTRGTFSYR